MSGAPKTRIRAMRRCWFFWSRLTVSFIQLTISTVSSVLLGTWLGDGETSPTSSVTNHTPKSGTKYFDTLPRGENRHLQTARLGLNSLRPCSPTSRHHDRFDITLESTSPLLPSARAQAEANA